MSQRGNFIVDYVEVKIVINSAK